MRSATSYFNGTLYRKTLARFWPLWGGYGVIWLFVLPLNLLNTYLSTDHSRAGAQRLMVNQAFSLPYMLGFGLFLAVVFSILSAMAVFGYLYNSRSACWTHALPLRREALFTTQYLAGLSFLLLPQLAAGVLTAVVELSFLPASVWGQTLTALLITILAQSGMILFFFSFAAFCAMFTGHILALPAFYGILNGLAAGVYYLIEALLQEFFYGYTWNAAAYEAVRYLTPVAALNQAIGWNSSTDLTGHLESSGLIAAYAAVGAVLALCSLYVYRRRHVETSGDVVAVPVVRPLFKYGVSFCAGLAFGVATAVFFSWTDAPFLTACILVWSVAGYFAAEMLLQKSFRVLKAWKGAAATAAVLLALCLVCFLDLFGVASRVPDPAQVVSVQVDLSLGYPYDSAQALNDTLTDPEQIQKICALHRAVVSNPDRSPDSYLEGRFYLNLSYTLKSGGQLDRRYYSVPLGRVEQGRPSDVAQPYLDILEDRALIRQAYGFDTFLRDARLTGAWLGEAAYGDGSSQVYLDGYEQELWDAVQADFAEGTLGVRYPDEYGQDLRKNTYRTDLVFECAPIRDASANRGNASYKASSTLSITLTPRARHTLAVLDQTGVWEEGWALSTYEGAYDPDLQYPETENW